MIRSIARLLLVLALVGFAARWLAQDDVERATKRSDGAATERDASARDPSTERRADAAEAIPDDSVQARVVDERGTPVPDAPVRLRLIANTGRSREERTDDDGRVRFALPKGHESANLRYGKETRYVRGGNSVTFVHWWRRTLELHVTIDGVPAIPERLVVRTPALESVERDPAAGILRGTFAPEGFRVPVRVDAEGLVLKDEVFACGYAPDRSVAHLRFVTGVHAEIRILGPDLQYQLHGRTAAGDDVRDLELHAAEFAEGRWTRQFLAAPGRYRVVAMPGEVVFGEFELIPDRRETIVDIDARDATWAEPRILLPEGVERDPERIGFLVEETGAFVRDGARVLHPERTTLTYVATGPLLAPADPGGRADRVRGGAFDLRLVHAPLLRFRVGGASRPTVTFLAAGRQLGPARDVADTGARPELVFAVAAPPAGTYDLVFQDWDYGNEAPLRIARGLDLDGARDIDRELRTIPVTTLTIRARNLSTDAGWPEARVRLLDPALDVPVEPGGLIDFRPGWRVPAAPRGRLEIELRAGTQVWRKTLRCDGRTRRTVEIDCAR